MTHPGVRILGAQEPREHGSPPVPDRVRLPLTFDAVRLQADLRALEAAQWTDHFVKDNYSGEWSAIPLRTGASTDDAHPILMLRSDPSETDFVDTRFLSDCPYFAEVLESLACPLGVVRVMKLTPGSVIKTHTDLDLSFEDGWVRLHVPIATNSGVTFVVNGESVSMAEGELWYLRLSDPHSVRNDGQTPRVHLVIDAPVGERLRSLFAAAEQRRRD